MADFANIKKLNSPFFAITTLLGGSSPKEPLPPTSFCSFLYSCHEHSFFQMKFKKYYQAVKIDVPGYEKDFIRAHIPHEQYGSNPSTPSPIQHSIHANDFSEDILMEAIDYENFHMNHQYGNEQFINNTRQ